MTHLSCKWSGVQWTTLSTLASHHSLGMFYRVTNFNLLNIHELSRESLLLSYIANENWRNQIHR